MPPPQCKPAYYWIKSKLSCCKQKSIKEFPDTEAQHHDTVQQLTFIVQINPTPGGTDVTVCSIATFASALYHGTCRWSELCHKCVTYIQININQQISCNQFSSGSPKIWQSNSTDKPGSTEYFTLYLVKAWYMKLHRRLALRKHLQTHTG